MSYDIESLHSDMLSEISDAYQKTIGFPTYDLTRAFALAIKSLSEDADFAMRKTDVDNLEGDELAKWCFQRKGISRTPATYAAGTVTVTESWSGGNIEVGDLFETPGGIQFTATQSVPGAVVGSTIPVKAVEPGASGNVAAGSITLMPVTLFGISGVTNEEATFGGYDAESDESLRARYYAAIVQPATSGNKYAYANWAGEIPGVGPVRVFPLAYGDNTVEVCILGNDMHPATQDLIAAVQDHIDPDSSGAGEGCAPIGAYCTVTTATPVNINVSCEAVLEVGADEAVVLENVKRSIDEYLASLAFQASEVSYARIANAVMGTEGVVDYTGLTVNGGNVNVAVGERQVAVRGTVTIA